MRAFNLRSVRLGPGEQLRETVSVALEPLELGGQRYEPEPESPEAQFTMTGVSSGTLFELAFEARLHGPCFRCLGEAAVTAQIDAREYQARDPDSNEPLMPYLADERLDLSQWARDAVALSLPAKILCYGDCAGLCAGCGANLNLERCTCGPSEPDTRWAKLAELRDRL